MKKIFLLLLTLSNCGYSFSQTKKELSLDKLNDTQCLKLENNINLLNSSAIILSTVAAPSGITSVFVDNDNAKIGLGISTVTLSAVSAGMQAYSQSLMKVWLRECGK